MLNFILVLLMLLAPPQPAADHFKKDAPALQADVDQAVSPAVYRIMQNSMASPLEGYGVIVVLEVTLEAPPNPFSNTKTGDQLRAVVTRRQQEIKDKISELLKQRVLKTDSVGATESLTVVVHMLNVTRADVPDLPTQFVISVRKDAPTQVNIKEF
jgi:hypothetical protein